jgi:putative ABC transport system substrate-binding protein
MRFVQLRRREFFALLGGLASNWSIAAYAQQRWLPFVGFLNPRSQSKGEAVANSFRQGLRDAGYEEGRNVAVECRWAAHESGHGPKQARACAFEMSA